jgi:hypothetical protein
MGINQIKSNQIKSKSLHRREQVLTTTTTTTTTTTN